LTPIGDVIAIGDVHGSINSLYQTLQANKVVDAQGDWIAGTRTVVQTGDLIGRGPDDLDVLQYIQRLQTQAATAGGAWIQLLGNHEWMELHRNYDYAVDGPGGIGFGSVQARDAALQGGELGTWLRSLPVIHQWEDVVFVHGGLTSLELATTGVDALNQHVTNYLAGKHTHASVANELLWTRALSAGPEKTACPALTAVLDTLGATKMVVGHTITATQGFAPGELGSRCNGQLHMIDVGMSSYFENIPKDWRAAHLYAPKPTPPCPADSKHEYIPAATAAIVKTSTQISAGAGDAGGAGDVSTVTPVQVHAAPVQLHGAPAEASGDGTAETIDYTNSPTSHAANQVIHPLLTTEQKAAQAAQEALELEAMAEAIAAPRIGLNGEDRSAPIPREGSGAGRKDYVYSKPVPIRSFSGSTPGTIKEGV
jgi:hypothetical protein